MKSSQILREAARLVEAGEESCGCGAIVEAARVPDEMAEDQACFDYFVMVKPRNGGHVWWWELDEDGDAARIIGLCLAAAIAESEGD